jgi:hypothetical protein
MAIELNYNIHNKEMLAIISIFKERRRYLDNEKYVILVFSNHRKLEYFTITKVLTTTIQDRPRN